MFELNTEEFENWRRHFGTSNADKIGLRYAPYAFTEYGVAIEKLERKAENHSKNIELLFQYFDDVNSKKGSAKPRKQIGYKIPKKERN